MIFDITSYTLNLEEERGERNVWMSIDSDHYKLVSSWVYNAEYVGIYGMPSQSAFPKWTGIGCINSALFNEK